VAISYSHPENSRQAQYDYLTSDFIRMSPVVEFEHLNQEAADRLRDLADRARVTLIAAGIQAFDITHQNPRGGAAIEVDTGADDAAGVYISWTFSEELTNEISNYLLTKQTSHPTFQYSGKIRLAMRDVIMTILNAAGLKASHSKDDMRPLAVLVSD
jgi:hypothetical protein